MTRPLIAGRALVFVGITLVALNMRTAVASLSPVVDNARADFDMSAWVLAALGMIPPLCYGIFGVLAGRIARRWGLERTLVVAFAALTIAMAARALAHGPIELLLWTTLLFAGIGVGNVLLPPLVKKFFPDRIGLMTTVYVTMFAIGNVVPPLLSVPIAEATNWRVAIGLWAVTAFVAILPWLAILRRTRRAAAPELPDMQAAAIRPWKSPMTWAILALFFCSGFNSYSFFAWMPQLLHDIAGVPAATSGALLGLYASLGFPLGMLIPILVARVNLARALVFTAVGCYTLGYGGLLFAPTLALPLWVVLSALGTLTFAASIVLINLRTRTHEAATATSSFVQGVGYLGCALGVFGFGLIHTITNGWAAPLWFLWICSLVLIPAALIVGRNQFIDDGA